MRKSITLIEFLVSLVLIGVVILAVFGIYNASSGFFISSDTKSVVLNEMAYLLDHIDKNVFLAIGWINNRAVTIPNPGANQFQININQDTNETPIDFTDDTTVTYLFNTSSNTVTFQGNLLTDKLIQHPDPAENLTINYNVADGVLTIDNFCLQQDPNSPHDAKTNPNICITSQKFSTSMQSLN
ncbi:MAG: hypothetical protein K9L76_01650 [Candidatus Omnitrophica bacterium]|nr:hypothetical protein [Candidatus Omnitrophota bacterium]